MEIMKMCGSSWTNAELGIFIKGEIWMNLGYSLRGNHPVGAKNLWIFWWYKR